MRSYSYLLMESLDATWMGSSAESIDLVWYHETYVTNVQFSIQHAQAFIYILHKQKLDWVNKSITRRVFFLIFVLSYNYLNALLTQKHCMKKTQDGWLLWKYCIKYACLYYTLTIQ